LRIGEVLNFVVEGKYLRPDASAAGAQAESAAAIVNANPIWTGTCDMAVSLSGADTP
jgi:hypothetical protein